ncbi:MAG: N-acetylmuramoyl-L-alanine amidase [Sphingobacteriales bacterium UTBCD1]|jgi:N-acetylmuramoyl-L-alanine amidase|nr:MAG: N-acetylmuramoyl-L-alanine amidase [Sphingobacteriales bacterium UTBCD1]
MNNFYRILFVLICIIILSACSHNPYISSNRSYKKQAKAYARILAQYPLKDSVENAPYWIGTTNFNMRKPNFVILHHTAQNSCGQTLKTFTTVRSQVSAHYVICKDGTVHHMLNDYLRAWQAGISKWGSATDINSVSIGIEIDNNGYEAFTDAQINSLIGLLGRLKSTYDIPTANFVGHADIAPGRKVDPNRYFPWQKLSENGFGFWYDTTGVKVPDNFDALQALRIIGYDIRKPGAAIYSFKLHFIQNDSTSVINDQDKKILYDLEKKYQ